MSLTVLGSRTLGDGFLRTIDMLHANFLIRDRSGHEIIGWLGVSGLVLWWPKPGRWKAAFLVRKGLLGVRLHRELHGAVGIWSLVVFIIVTFSGVWTHRAEEDRAFRHPAGRLKLATSGAW